MKTFFHGHSYTANPLACSAAVSSIRILKRSGEQLQQLVRWQKEFAKTIQGHPKIENLRQQGTIVAFEVSAPESNYFNSIRDMLYDQFIERGVLLRPLGNTVYILPPFCITREQLNRVYQVIREVLDLL
jgi:adenosylmethionine-8-amino-7-oxononanoate aminotransferase